MDVLEAGMGGEIDAMVKSYANIRSLAEIGCKGKRPLVVN
jgi:hypothetical protein